ncbi:MORN repeat protein [Babesia bovis T2Bo]|uniref:MORN repeat protein n=1 Tax=Babesia bovis TaxID=5865 RepID=A7AQL6_BABBO|nr:MORN repeat protein [Babesia bovis T2Bo]EDO06835.1 MORN repeat protein [Babesia bovis T2Bo]|eukprot:XP_001610403.1 MORN repeat protein [Babesia bovis T2Bo]
MSDPVDIDANDPMDVGQGEEELPPLQEASAIEIGPHDDSGLVENEHSVDAADINPADPLFPDPLDRSNSEALFTFDPMVPLLSKETADKMALYVTESHGPPIVGATIVRCEDNVVNVDFTYPSSLLHFQQPLDTTELHVNDANNWTSKGKTAIHELESSFYLVPRLALGAMKDSSLVDFVYFTLPTPSGNYLYGISFVAKFETIKTIGLPLNHDSSDGPCSQCRHYPDGEHVVDVPNLPPDASLAYYQGKRRVTSFVAICVITKVPFFCYIGSRLECIAQTYFHQQCFSDHDLLTSFVNHMNSTEIVEGWSYESLYFNLEWYFKPVSLCLSYRALLFTIKCIMLGRKVAVYSQSAARTSTAILSIISMVPGAITLGFNSRSFGSMWHSWRKYAMPLDIFNSKNLIFPYFTKEMVSLLDGVEGYVIGITDHGIMMSLDSTPDFLINLELNNVQLMNITLLDMYHPSLYEAQHFERLMEPDYDTEDEELMKSMVETGGAVYSTISSYLAMTPQTLIDIGGSLKRIMGNTSSNRAEIRCNESALDFLDKMYPGSVPKWLKTRASIKDKKRKNEKKAEDSKDGAEAAPSSPDTDASTSAGTLPSSSPPSQSPMQSTEKPLTILDKFVEMCSDGNCYHYLGYVEHLHIGLPGKERIREIEYAINNRVNPMQEYWLKFLTDVAYVCGEYRLLYHLVMDFKFDYESLSDCSHPVKGTVIKRGDTYLRGELPEAHMGENGIIDFLLNDGCTCGLPDEAIENYEVPTQTIDAEDKPLTISKEMAQKPKKPAKLPKPKDKPTSHIKGVMDRVINHVKKEATLLTKSKTNFKKMKTKKLKSDHLNQFLSFFSGFAYGKPTKSKKPSEKPPKKSAEKKKPKKVPRRKAAEKKPFGTLVKNKPSKRSTTEDTSKPVDAEGYASEDYEYLSDRPEDEDVVSAVSEDDEYCPTEAATDDVESMDEAASDNTYIECESASDDASIYNDIDEDNDDQTSEYQDDYNQEVPDEAEPDASEEEPVPNETYEEAESEREQSEQEASEEEYEEKVPDEAEPDASDEEPVPNETYDEAESEREQSEPEEASEEEYVEEVPDEAEPDASEEEPVPNETYEEAESEREQSEQEASEEEYEEEVPDEAEPDASEEEPVPNETYEEAESEREQSEPEEASEEEYEEEVPDEAEPDASEEEPVPNETYEEAESEREQSEQEASEEEYEEEVTADRSEEAEVHNESSEEEDIQDESDGREPMAEESDGEKSEPEEETKAEPEETYEDQDVAEETYEEQVEPEDTYEAKSELEETYEEQPVAEDTYEDQAEPEDTYEEQPVAEDTYEEQVEPEKSYEDEQEYEPIPQETHEEEDEPEQLDEYESESKVHEDEASLETSKADVEPMQGHEDGYDGREQDGYDDEMKEQHAQEPIVDEWHDAETASQPAVQGDLDTSAYVEDDAERDDQFEDYETSDDDSQEPIESSAAPEYDQDHQPAEQHPGQLDEPHDGESRMEEEPVSQEDTGDDKHASDDEENVHEAEVDGVEEREDAADGRDVDPYIDNEQTPVDDVEYDDFVSPSRHEYPDGEYDSVDRAYNEPLDVTDSATVEPSGEQPASTMEEDVGDIEEYADADDRPVEDTEAPASSSMPVDSEYAGKDAGEDDTVPYVDIDKVETEYVEDDIPRPSSQDDAVSPEDHSADTTESVEPESRPQEDIEATTTLPGEDAGEQLSSETSATQEGESTSQEPVRMDAESVTTAQRAEGDVDGEFVDATESLESSVVEDGQETNKTAVPPLDTAEPGASVPTDDKDVTKREVDYDHDSSAYNSAEEGSDVDEPNILVPLDGQDVMTSKPGDPLPPDGVVATDGKTLSQEVDLTTQDGMQVVDDQLLPKEGDSLVEDGTDAIDGQPISADSIQPDDIVPADKVPKKVRKPKVHRIVIRDIKPDARKRKLKQIKYRKPPPPPPETPAPDVPVVKPRRKSAPIRCHTKRPGDEELSFEVTGNLATRIMELQNNHSIDFLEHWTNSSCAKQFINGHQLATFIDPIYYPSGEAAKQKYPNGDVYIGEMSYMLRNGKGTYITVDGTVYEGDWVRGKRHGKGTLLSSKYGYKYVGSWCEDKRDGHGELTTPHFVYVGSFKNNNFHGNGRLSNTGKDSYEGDFVNGKYHGRGRLTQKDGTIMIGSFENNKMYGLCSVIKPDGRIYVGNLYGDVLDGTGTLIYDKYVTFEGEWSRGIRSGQGIVTIKLSESVSSDAITIEGIWHKDSLDMSDVLIKFPNGYKYTGSACLCTDLSAVMYDAQCEESVSRLIEESFLSFTNRILPHGHGIIKSSNGSTYSGDIFNGMRHGQGIMMFSNGSTYIGGWAYGSVHGTGDMTIPGVSEPLAVEFRYGNLVNGSEYIDNIKECLDEIGSPGFEKEFTLHNLEPISGLLIASPSTV